MTYYNIQKKKKKGFLPVVESSLLESSSRELNTDSYENCGILQTQCSEPDELSDAEEDPTLRRV